MATQQIFSGKIHTHPIIENSGEEGDLKSESKN